MTPQRIRPSGDLYHRVIPENAVYVGRPSRWGNPHRVGGCTRCLTGHDARDAVALFAEDLQAGRLKVTADDVRRELAGRDLACWCKPDQRCHADVLLAVANSKENTL